MRGKTCFTFHDQEIKSHPKKKNYLTSNQVSRNSNSRTKQNFQNMKIPIIANEFSTVSTNHDCREQELMPWFPLYNNPQHADLNSPTAYVDHTATA